MKVTSQELKQIWDKAPKEKLQSYLRYVFSFPENIELFSQFFFPEIVSNKIPDFHQEIYDELFKKKNSAIAAPRGHAKSTITGLVFLIFNIVNSLEQYIVYISQNHAKTVQFLSPIRHEFKNNNMLKFVYGDLSPRLSKDDEGKDREDCFDVNGIRIEAVSFEKNLRGFKYNNIRPTLIICDDIEDDMRVLNPELRIKDSNKLNKIIIPSLDVKGRIKMIGTLLHIDSLLHKKIQQYKGLVYRACDEKLNKIIWKDRFNKKLLQKIKEDIGSVPFEQEYLNNPINTTNSIIKRDWIDKCTDTELSYDNVNKNITYSFKALGVDFAFSDRVSADKSAFVSLGTFHKQYVVTFCDTKKGMSVNDQMNYITTLQNSHKFDMIALEENSIKAVSKDLSSYNLPITLFWTGANDPANRLKEQGNYFGKRHTVGKINMIMRLASAFENEEIVLPYKTKKDKEITEQIASECMSFALAEGKLVEAGVHPDIPIALGFALEVSKGVGSIILDFGGGK